LKTGRYYDFGPYRLDRHAKILLREGMVVALTPKVIDTLVVLVENRGGIVSKDELLKAVWPDSFVEENNLSQNISVLRKALAQGQDKTLYIETTPKRGYRFVAEVKIAAVETGPVTPVEVEKTVSSEPANANPPGAPPLKVARFYTRTTAAIFAALILGGALTIWYTQHRRAGPAIRSLAVLPLKNLSGDPGQDYFADEITQLLTAEISRAVPLRVTSSTSAMHYRNSDKPLRTVARELGVDAVLEGSVARSGDRLLITAQLIHVASDQHLWAATYGREIADGLVLQQEIGRTVAHEVRASIVPARNGPPRRIDRTAFEDSLRARYYLDQRNTESIPQAISWYKKAISEDPLYARAYAGLADSYNQLGTVMIGGQSPAESRKLAIAAASRALEIDPDLAEAHAALGYSYLYEWNWDRSRDSLERAVALNPNYAPGHLWLCHYLAARGRFDEAMQQILLARDLDPLSPIVRTQVGWILAFAGRYREAIREYRKVLESEPEYQWGKWQLGIALMKTGEYAESIRVLQLAAARNRTPSVLGTLGLVYGKAGQRKQAEAVLNELLALSPRQYVSPHCFVDVYSGLRNSEKVFEWLEKSYQERSHSLLWLRVSRDVDWLESDPRFDNLMHRIGFN